MTNCFCRHTAERLGTRCDNPLETCMSVDRAAEYLIRHRSRPADRQHRGPRAPCCGPRARPGAHRRQRAAADQLHLQLLLLLLPRAPLGSEGPAGRAAERVPAPARRRALQGLRPLRSSLPRPGDLAGGARHPLRRRRPGVAATSQPDRRRPLPRLRGVHRRLSRGRAHHAPAPHQPYVPLDAVEQLTRRMLERGRLAELLIDGTAGRGPAFADAVLGAVLSLPPARGSWRARG